VHLRSTLILNVNSPAPLMRSMRALSMRGGVSGATRVPSGCPRAADHERPVTTAERDPDFGERKPNGARD
jgi:hypothetical protein